MPCKCNAEACLRCQTEMLATLVGKRSHGLPRHPDAFVTLDAIFRDVYGDSRSAMLDHQPWLKRQLLILDCWPIAVIR